MDKLLGLIALGAIVVGMFLYPVNNGGGDGTPYVQPTTFTHLYCDGELYNPHSTFTLEGDLRGVAGLSSYQFMGDIKFVGDIYPINLTGVATINQDTLGLNQLTFTFNRDKQVYPTNVLNVQGFVLGLMWGDNKTFPRLHSVDWAYLGGKFPTHPATLNCVGS